MVNAILGRKVGMTQVFDEYGSAIPVTALSVGPCVVLGVTDKNVRLGYEDLPEKKVKKPQLGMFKKLNVNPKKVIREIENKSDSKDISVGQEVKIDIFKEGDFLDIVGTSIGKGFQGGMKRWNWSGQPKSHGSMMHRRPGSIGASAYPSRVFKGQRLPGHMGNERVTVQNVRVVRIDQQNNILLVKGPVPGHNKGLLVITKAKKRQNKQAKQDKQ